MGQMSSLNQSVWLGQAPLQERREGSTPTGHRHKRKAGPQSAVAPGTSLQTRQQMPSARKQELVHSTNTFSTDVCAGVKSKQHS